MKENAGGVPQRRTSTFSSALLPVGTDGVRHVGNAGQQLAVFLVEFFGAFVQRGGAVAHFADFLLALGCVLAGFDELADFLRFAFCAGP